MCWWSHSGPPQVHCLTDHCISAAHWSDSATFKGRAAIYEHRFAFDRVGEPADRLAATRQYLAALLRSFKLDPTEFASNLFASRWQPLAAELAPGCEPGLRCNNTRLASEYLFARYHVALELDVEFSQRRFSELQEFFGTYLSPADDPDVMGITQIELADWAEQLLGPLVGPTNLFCFLRDCGL